MEWTEATITRLWDLWHSGMLTEDIGRELHCSRNAVVGKAHRIGCTPRPSPIIRRDQSRPAPAPRVPRPVTRPVGSTLPPLSTQLPLPERAPRVAYAADRRAPEPVVVPIPTGRVVECCFPIGHPGTRAFRFCEAPSVPGKPYCEACCSRVYVKTHRQEHMEA